MHLCLCVLLVHTQLTWFFRFDLLPCACCVSSVTIEYYFHCAHCGGWLSWLFSHIYLFCAIFDREIREHFQWGNVDIITVWLFLFRKLQQCYTEFQPCRQLFEFCSYTASYQCAISLATVSSVWIYGCPVSASRSLMCWKTNLERPSQLSLYVYDRPW